MNRTITALFALLALACASAAGAYPIDGFERTGIRRLAGSHNADPAARKGKLAPGGLLGLADVKLSLDGVNENWDVGSESVDPVLQAALAGIFADRDPSYSITVIDITNPNDIEWAGVREDVKFYPGSVGKVLCMVGLFDGLRRAFPDTGVRERVLRETMVAADSWSSGDSHKVPKPNATGGNTWAPIQSGEVYTLSEWLDHAISASANSAGAMLWKQAILLRQFGSAYPPTKEQEKQFWDTTPKGKLQTISLQCIEDALKAAGVDAPGNIRQGTMWTNYGQSRIPGTTSYGTPREWARVYLRIEQGRMVDEWSSLEMKRYLYLTKKRYRYCYAPELREAAVYFKSGSLYSCRAEPGHACGKYKGNIKNFMNSVCIIESPSTPGQEQRRYIVALMSNVLRTNSAWDHARLGAAVEEAVLTRKPPVVKEGGSEAAISDSMKSE